MSFSAGTWLAIGCALIAFLILRSIWRSTRLLLVIAAICIGIAVLMGTQFTDDLFSWVRDAWDWSYEKISSLF